MKLYKFPLAPLEKAIAKRMLTLAPHYKEWFASRWAQKPYKKAFIENKAMPLITLLATALVVYWIIHLMKLDRLDRKKD